MDDSERAGVPSRAALHPSGLYFAVRPIPPSELKEPFLHETIARMGLPEAILPVTEDDFGKMAPADAPAGVIFHLGRSGSTLISQLLRKLDTVVYAEPLAVNEILGPPHNWARAKRIAALRSLATAFARHARRRYVLKLSSWNTLYCEMVAEAFPDTPWVFSYRDPLEVGVSILRVLPGWFRNEEGSPQELAKVIDPHVESRSAEDYVGRALGALCQAIAALDPARGRLVPYEALPSAVWDSVAPHFSLSIDTEQRRLMANAARTYAKALPGEAIAFVPDSTTKQKEASPRLRRAIDTYARPELEKLKSLHRR